MKGLLYYGNRDLRYSEDIETPQIRNANEVQIDVAWCGICGSDLHEYLEGPLFMPTVADHISGKKMPLCIGHEFSGVVKTIGKDVTHVKVGDNVVVEATTHCSDRPRFCNDHSKCLACSQGFFNCCSRLSFTGLGTDHGGFSDTVVVGADHVLKIPDNIPLDIGALVEPLSVAWHAVERSNLREGQSALVLGGGPIGLAVVMALQGHNAGKIVVSEPAEIRRQFAANLGVEVFNPTEHDDCVGALRELMGIKEGFDASYDCSGVPATLLQSIEALGPKGIAINVAVWPNVPTPYMPMDLTFQEKTATGSMCYTITDFEQVIEALHTGQMSMEKVRMLITGKINLKDGIEQGFARLISHKEQNVKILVTPHAI
ncbi:unnamed protein product [Kuraishia capsulata CBS 1993]|uniref:Enoyl reductase (ER) domain-containing protein n=1 Tax=Kuraishia capsulata CBS 1993 TaxID=1382522 RepID=W6MF89_9ASCO|nr:uncharacterized protein KUCA_T00000086001 [Kuraishia capsulata CBS 1993]CDK24126.1 unnamed protein product [Kuraishia capsulata CBS 1993]